MKINSTSKPLAPLNIFNQNIAMSSAPATYTADQLVCYSFSYIISCMLTIQFGARRSKQMITTPELLLTTTQVSSKQSVVVAVRQKFGRRSEILT